MKDIASRPLRVVYFGTTGRLSAPPLRALLEAGVDVRAVVLSALATGASAPAHRAALPARPAWRPCHRLSVRPSHAARRITDGWRAPRG